MPELAQVSSLRPADDVVRMFRQLADRSIESGDAKAEEVLCIVRSGSRTLDLWAWGDYRGDIMALGMLDAAKKLINFESQSE